MQYGYARVSTVQQDTALQMAAFKAAGVRRVVQEKRSGVAHRPALEDVLRRLQAGDELVVYRLDRLARSLVDLLRIIDRVSVAGATFRSLTEPIETVTPIGRAMLQILGVVAELERQVIRERCAAGRAAARASGVRFGRPVTLDRAEVLRLKAEGLTYPQIGERLGFSRSSVIRCVRGVRVADGGTGYAPRASVP